MFKIPLSICINTNIQIRTQQHMNTGNLESITKCFRANLCLYDLWTLFLIVK